jgi:hypothetical protein
MFQNPRYIGMKGEGFEYTIMRGKIEAAAFQRFKLNWNIEMSAVFSQS